MDKFVYPVSFILNQYKHGEREYDESLQLKRNIHKGQIKLFSNELLFILNHVYDSLSDNIQKLIVYVGAGPGHHLPLLIKMFPKLNWHLYDCRFDNKLSYFENVKLYQRYFEDTDLENYKKLKSKFDIYFISDIRDLSYDPKKQTLEEEMKIFNDMDLQKNWVKELKAKYSMIKFRPPFPVQHVLDYLKKDYIEYLPGIIYKQPWAKITSVETRLVIHEKDCNKTAYYNLKKYESQMFYHNSIFRNKNFIFPLSGVFNDQNIDGKTKINTKYDFAFIITLFYHYFMRLNKEDANVDKKIIKALKLLWITKE